MPSVSKTLIEGARRAGDDYNNFSDLSLLVDAFNKVSADVYSIGKWAWLNKRSTIELVIGERNYDLPQDFLSFRTIPRSTSDTRKTYTLREEDEQFAIDPDEDDTGEYGEASVLLGRDTTDGRWNIYIYPTPLKTDSLLYRYNATIQDITINDMELDMDLFIPRHIQTAWTHGVAKYRLLDKGINQQFEIEANEYRDIIGKARDQQVIQQETRRVRMKRSRGSNYVLAYDDPRVLPDLD